MSKLINVSVNKSVGTTLLVVILLLLTLASSYLIAENGVVIGVVLVLVFIGIPLAVACFLNLRFGIMLSIFLSFFLFLIKRLTQDAVPAGVFADAAIFLTFIGVFVQKEFKIENFSAYLRTPVFVTFIIWLLYWFLQIGNPYAVSLQGWIFTIRGTLVTVFFVVICFYVFSNLKTIKNYTIFWLFMSLLAALYGIFQEFHGFLPFEEKWLRENPEQMKLVFNWGRFRRWSFLSDVSIFGMLMSYAGIVALIMALGPYKIKYRIMLAIAGILMLIAMSFSGTRTATAMIPAGLVLFLLMTINNLRTVIIAAFLALTFTALMIGPFHSGPIRRMRSTFTPDKDASMQVREVNRQRIRPYLWKHPFGGGVATTGSEGTDVAKGHPLAGFPPDSGYLKIALERGWIGLIVTMALHFSVLFVSIKNYYASRSPVVKNLYAAYTVAFFSLLVANYAQEILQKPLDIIMLSSYMLAIKLKNFDDPL